MASIKWSEAEPYLIIYTIPHYIQGNKVYFFEDELIKWVEKGRVATLQEKYTSKRNY